jgi:co-chaperonin GroES (HSP10)
MSEYVYSLLGLNILVEVLPEENVTPTGLTVVKHEKNPVQIAVVQSVGPDVKTVKPGMTVGISEYAGQELPLKDKVETRLIREPDVLFIRTPATCYTGQMYLPLNPECGSGSCCG